MTCFALGAFTITQVATLLVDGDGATRKRDDSTAWGTMHSLLEDAPGSVLFRAWGIGERVEWRKRERRERERSERNEKIVRYVGLMDCNLSPPQ